MKILLNLKDPKLAEKNTFVHSTPGYWAGGPTAEVLLDDYHTRHNGAF